MRLDQPGQAIVDLLPDLARHHGFERRGGKVEGEVARPAVAGVDDRALVARGGPDEEASDGLDRFLGGRQANPVQAIATKRRQAQLRLDIALIPWARRSGHVCHP